MAVIALQGLRGGVGTTSITAALAWGLQQLGESVLVIDMTPANLLRMHFNTDFAHSQGWARAEDAALRYTELLNYWISCLLGRLTVMSTLNFLLT